MCYSGCRPPSSSTVGTDAEPTGEVKFGFGSRREASMGLHDPTLAPAPGLPHTYHKKSRMSTYEPGPGGAQHGREPGQRSRRPRPRTETGALAVRPPSAPACRNAPRPANPGR